MLWSSRSKSKFIFAFIVGFLFPGVFVSQSLVGAFNNPSPLICSTLKARARGSYKLSSRFGLTQSRAQTKSWASNPRTGGIDGDVSQTMPAWMTKRMVATTALVTAAALGAPSVSHAAPALTEFGSSLAGGAINLSTSASAILEKLSETGFYQAFSLVFLSEIGDKTFFIAGLLSMKTSRFVSFVGSIGALAAMTVLSCVIGQIFHAVPAGVAQGIPIDDIAAVGAFAFFGIKTLTEALEMDEEGGSVMDEELAEAEETVEGSDTVKQVTAWAQIASTFGLVFAAEFGDRSFLATIALAAAQNPFSVAGGAIAAHAMATGIAVAGGSYIAKYISEKAIGIIGGTLFIVFAVTTALGIF